MRRSAVKLSNKDARKRGLRVESFGLKSQPDVLVVPKFKGETVTVKNKSINYTSNEGVRIQRLELPPVRHDTLANFFEDLKKIDIHKIERDFPDYKIGVRFFTGRTVLFSPSQLKYMLNKINAYDTVVSAHGRKNTSEVIRNIELILVPNGDDNKWYEAKNAAKDKKRAASFMKASERKRHR